MRKEKPFHLRLDAELHRFLKRYVLDHDTSMTVLLNEYVRKLKNNSEKRLTHKDINV